MAAFEPALDYVVVKLPRFPFDKFPSADRSLGSQMKATGEVMAIDRTFGAALNKAFRGLEQAGAGPLAEDPAWGPTLDYLAVALGGDDADEADTVIRWIDENGAMCEASRLAQRTAARSSCAASWPRRTIGSGACWRCSAAAWRRRSWSTATGIAPWFLAELGRSSRWGAAARRGAGAARRRPQRRRGRRHGDGDPPGDRQAGRLGDRDIATLAGGRGARGRRERGRLGLRPGFAMVDTCAGEFAAETPYFYATYAAAGSPPEAPPVARPAALVIG